MGWIKRLSATVGGGRGLRSAARRRARPGIEGLEKREVLYSASGNAWPAAQLVTISFVPDGTNIGGKTSDLQARFNSMFGSASTWQGTILKAAQTWASYANVNFELVPDSGAAQGSGSYQQGDPGFGDIRIGGNNFNSSTLATAYMPPPVNNYSVAGDIQFNTGQVYKNGNTYDLFTVAVHEIGHALGLYHSSTSSAQEYATYNGVKSGLNADDIAGVKAVYGTRSIDAYDADGANDSASTADNISSKIDPATLTGLVTNLDLTTAADVDYYKFTVPAGASSTISIQVSSDGLSLLSPSVQILNASGSVVAQNTTSGSSVSKTLSLSSVVPGQVYTIKVDGTDSTVLGMGAYAIALNLGPNPMPVIPTPNTQLANGSPAQTGGGQAVFTGPETRANTYTTGAQGFNPENSHTIGIDAAGNFVTVWNSSGQDGSGVGVYGQRFNSGGAKVGSEFRINTTTAGDQQEPTLAVAPDGTFVVAWQSTGQDAVASMGVYAQRFDAAGNRVGGEFLVNTTTAGDQTDPDLGIDASGNFVITWVSSGQDGNGQGVYAQRFDAAGNRVGGEFLVNTTTAGDQTNGAIVLGSAGNFVITWAGPDGSGTGVYARRYDAAGVAQGGEILVNEVTAGDQGFPRPAVDRAGNFIVTWTSTGQDGSGRSVQARRFLADGTPRGGEFRANTFTTGDQAYSNVAMDLDGSFFLVWSSSGQDSSGWGVYMKQYDAAGAAIGDEVLVQTTTTKDQMYPTIDMNGNGQMAIAWTGNGSSDTGGAFYQRFDTRAAGLVVDHGALDRGQRIAERLAVQRELAREYRAARKAKNSAAMKSIRGDLARLRAEAREDRNDFPPARPRARPEPDRSSTSPPTRTADRLGHDVLKNDDQNASGRRSPGDEVAALDAGVIDAIFGQASPGLGSGRRKRGH